jgi:hypothetical protein
MRNAPLKLQCADDRVTGTIMTFVGPSLMEAHYLLCVMPISTSSSGEAQPHTFPRPATAMLLIAIAALSTIPYFDPAANGALKKDQRVEGARRQRQVHGVHAAVLPLVQRSWRRPRR